MGDNEHLSRLHGEDVQLVLRMLGSHLVGIGRVCKRSSLNGFRDLLGLSDGARYHQDAER